MKAALFNLVTISLLLTAAMAGETGPSAGAVTTDVSLGHKDFYRSSQRPVGFRGDEGMKPPGNVGDGVGTDNADDWPQWRGGPARTGAVTNGPTLASTWPTNGPPLVWKAALPVSNSPGSVSVARRRAYVSQAELSPTQQLVGAVYCLDVADGKFVYSTSGRGRHAAPAAKLFLVQAGPSPRILAQADVKGLLDHASPTIADGRLFLRVNDGVVCFDLRAERTRQ